MQILDKNKDYYDYIQFRFGQEVDKTNTYDRRGSQIVYQQDLLKQLFQRIINANWDIQNKEHYFLLEAGYKLFLIRAYDATRKSSLETAFPWEYVYDAKFELVKQGTRTTHLGPTPLTLILNYHTPQNERWRYAKDEKNLDFNSVFLSKDEKDIISDPILKDTKIPSIISADQIFDAIDVYTRRLNDDKVSPDISNDKEKAVNHGIDPKTGFRGRWWEP
jgi:hypothetical protein